MAGRTLLQQAVPVTFGLKAAGWLAGLENARRWLVEVRVERLAAQLGGAAGTLASLGDAGPQVLAAYATALGLAEPALPWHTLRGRIGELASALAVVSGAVAKAAQDIVLLAQTEVAEVREGAGGGSSTMPHKHNPVAAISALACAQQAPGLVATLLAAMVQEHERAAGAWHAEWRPFSELLRATGSAVAWLRESLERLTVDEDRIRANLQLTGLDLVSERGRWDLGEDPDPAHYLGSAQAFVARALERYA
jgi:3-carboxy-cis,cis-muconate cycloisomerase